MVGHIVLLLWLGLAWCMPYSLISDVTTWYRNRASPYWLQTSWCFWDQLPSFLAWVGLHPTQIATICHPSGCDTPWRNTSATLIRKQSTLPSNHGHMEPTALLLEPFEGLLTYRHITGRLYQPWHIPALISYSDSALTHYSLLMSRSTWDWYSVLYLVPETLNELLYRTQCWN